MNNCRVGATPLGLLFFAHYTQGSSFLATLGFIAEPLWDSQRGCAFRADSRPVGGLHPELRSRESAPLLTATRNGSESESQHVLYEVNTGVERSTCAAVSRAFCPRLDQNSHASRQRTETEVTNRFSNQFIILPDLVDGLWIRHVESSYSFESRTDFSLGLEQPRTNNYAPEFREKVAALKRGFQYVDRINHRDGHRFFYSNRSRRQALQRNELQFPRTEVRVLAAIDWHPQVPFQNMASPALVDSSTTPNGDTVCVRERPQLMSV